MRSKPKLYVVIGEYVAEDYSDEWFSVEGVYSSEEVAGNNPRGNSNETELKDAEVMPPKPVKLYVVTDSLAPYEALGVYVSEAEANKHHPNNFVTEWDLDDET